MIFVVLVLKALVEVALVACVGQAVLYVLAGANRERNPVYTLFRIVTRPVMRLARWIAPRFVLDQHVPLFGFFLLLVADGLLIVAKLYFLVQLGATPG